MFVIVSSLSFVLPNSTALALADHAEVAGTASALLGIGQFLIGALVRAAGRRGGDGQRGADGRGDDRAALAALLARQFAGSRRRLAR